MVDRERVGWIWRDSVGDFAISKGSKISLREFNVTPGLVWLSRGTRRGAWLRGKLESKGRTNWTARIFTGHKGWPSLRRKQYHTRGHQGTAPRTLFVAFNPLSLYLPPPSLHHPCFNQHSFSKVLEYSPFIFNKLLIFHINYEL